MNFIRRNPDDPFDRLKDERDAELTRAFEALADEWAAQAPGRSRYGFVLELDLGDDDERRLREFPAKMAAALRRVLA